jgi:hypothetical protein
MDLVAALRPVADALASLGVRYYVGGSLTSSAHGIARASRGADRTYPRRWSPSLDVADLLERALAAAVS